MKNRGIVEKDILDLLSRNPGLEVFEWFLNSGDLLFESNFVLKVLEVCPLISHLSLEESFTVNLNELSAIIADRQTSTLPIESLKVSHHTDNFEFGFDKPGFLRVTLCGMSQGTLQDRSAFLRRHRGFSEMRLESLPVNNDFLALLAENNPALTMLQIVRCGEDFDSEGLHQILTGCNQLRHLWLLSSCDHIGKEELVDLFKTPSSITSLSISDYKFMCSLTAIRLLMHNPQLTDVTLSGAQHNWHFSEEVVREYLHAHDRVTELYVY
jgi:hypothetical protein